jgi:putative endonuclease
MTKSSKNVPPPPSPSPDLRRLKGALGEQAAERYLRRAGMEIVARSFRFRGGEIDLIAREGEEWVFVEVKTRASDDFGSPVESVTLLKRRKILLAASSFLQRRAAWTHPCRFDVISIRLQGDGSMRLEHLRDAFRADG